LDVDLYTPIIVLGIILQKNSREMETHLSENAVARVFVNMEHSANIQIRDHSNIARINEALGLEGMLELNTAIIHQATKYGFADPKILSADTTAQELPIGYPHEAGIMKGMAERSGRALKKIKETVQKTKGKVKEKVRRAMKRCGKIIQKAKEYHLFAKGKEKKDEILQEMVKQTKKMLLETKQLMRQMGVATNASTKSAQEQLQKMVDVGHILLPQILHWLKTQTVAKGKIIHTGITEARAIVRNKVGKKVEFGFQYLICSVGGGYLFGTLLIKSIGESKMPKKALALYRELYGQEESPDIEIYDRGGYSAYNSAWLKKEGIKNGIQPKGKAHYGVRGKDRELVKKERAMMEGKIGSLKTEKYKFNKPKARKSANVKASGIRSILSFNINKFMRDVMRRNFGCVRAAA
jgi:hypothetical protein